MPGEDVSWKEIIEAGVNTELDRIFKACPATVTAYDPLTNTAFVRPSVKRALYTSSGARKYEALPEIPFVPVMWQRGGGMVSRLPLSAGDSVLLVFSDVSLAEWRDGADPAEPTDARLHGFGWPVAIPGLFPDTSILPALDGAEVALGGAIFGDENSPAQMIVNGLFPGIRFGKLAVSPIALAVPLLAYVTAAAAASTAGGAADSTIVSALTAIQAALAAIVAIPANSAAATAVTASGSAVSAANTSLAASATAATAAGAAATTAAGAVPSTLVKSL